MDRDSYNSGDHFNRVDWTGQDNNFGVGLPPSTKNRQGWHYKTKLIANPMVKPNASHIQTATEIFQMLLKIRCSILTLSRQLHVLSSTSPVDLSLNLLSRAHMQVLISPIPLVEA